MKKENTATKINKKIPTVKMIEYSIKMVIPTGQYANIQPEIKVTAATPEEAHEYIAPHMNKMWKDYFMVNERVTQEAPKICPATPAELPHSPHPANEVCEAPPASNVSVIKATQAIESCLSLEALDLIKNQVELSVKLTKEEKPKLRGMIVEKFNELNADAFIKRNT
jgi:hypothetical protein